MGVFFFLRRDFPLSLLCDKRTTRLRLALLTAPSLGVFSPCMQPAALGIAGPFARETGAARLPNAENGPFCSQRRPKFFPRFFPFRPRFRASIVRASLTPSTSFLLSLTTSPASFFFPSGKIAIDDGVLFPASRHVRTPFLPPLPFLEQQADHKPPLTEVGISCTFFLRRMTERFFPILPRSSSSAGFSMSLFLSSWTNLPAPPPSETAVPLGILPFFRCSKSFSLLFPMRIG